MIKSYKDLDVWKRSIKLVKDVYNLTEDFPEKEKFGLIAQIRRSAVSVPSNIAEGKTRQHKREYIQFLYIALGSCSELETQIIIARKLDFVDRSNSDIFLEEIDHISRMIRSLAINLNR